MHMHLSISNFDFYFTKMNNGLKNKSDHKSQCVTFSFLSKNKISSENINKKKHSAAEPTNVHI